MINWIQKKRNKKGFTLIELVVVIAILGILAALALPRLTGVQKGASINADIAVATTIINGAKLYVAEQNIATDDDLTDIDIETLTGANLIDDPGQTKTTKKDFVLEVTGTVADPVFTVTDGTDEILPDTSDTFKK